MIKEWKDTTQGIEVRPTNFVNEITVAYKGLLAQQNPSQLYIHYGFGDPYHWSHTSTEPMNPTPRGTWEKTIRLKEDPCFFCFKDAADNWDNNRYENWYVRYE